MKNEALANEIERRLAECTAKKIFPNVKLLGWENIKMAIAALRANAAPQGGQWVPIAAAPDIWKDGRELLLYDAVEKITVVGQWGKHNHVPLYGWIRHIELYGEEVDGFSPTHAMPLPAAPDFLPSPVAGHAEGGVGGDAFDDWMHEYLCSGRVSDSRCDPTTVLFNLNDMREAYEAGAPK